MFMNGEFLNKIITHSFENDLQFFVKLMKNILRIFSFKHNVFLYN
jgi:hypothetical protein